MVSEMPVILQEEKQAEVKERKAPYREDDYTLALLALFRGQVSVDGKLVDLVRNAVNFVAYDHGQVEKDEYLDAVD
jgi:hypothetical protein